MLKKIGKTLLWVIGIVVSLLLLLVAICYLWVSNHKESVKPDDYSWPNHLTEQEIDDTTTYLISQMSLDEKIAQLYGDKATFLKMGIGMLFNRSAAHIMSGNNQRLEIPPFIFSDGPRGVVMSRKATCFPVAMGRGASWDVELEKRIGDVIGKEMRAEGVNYFGGLCLNILRHPSWGRAQETFGEDPYHLGEMGLALMQGVQQHNVMACAKHFALNNIENNRFYVNVETDERTLREVYLPHFKKVVQHGVGSIMSAYNDFRGELCGHNSYLLDQILRKEWGFKGFVSSDWMWGLEDTRDGIKAGMDVEMPIPKYYTLDKIEKALAAHEITEDDLDNMVHRVVRTKLKFITQPDPMEYRKDLLSSETHRLLARESAEKSMVLLKNQDGILPLDKGMIETIAVIGKLADVPSIGDHGSSWVTPPYTVTPLQGLQNQAGNDIQILFDTGEDLEKVKSLAKQADVVLIVAGYEHDDEGEYIVMSSDMSYVTRPRTFEQEEEAKKNKKWFERFVGGDRLSLDLKGRDTRIIHAVSEMNDNVIVSVICGSAVTMEGWKEKVKGILLMWYPGMEGGNAWSNILFGEINPSGKLPFTIPERLDQLPSFDAFTEEIFYDYYHGYTLFDKSGDQPTWPFGYGLSYTTFSYDSVLVQTPTLQSGETLKIEVQVSNRGSMTGEEVVQLYIGFSNSQIDRPLKLLRAFDKIAIKPGETRRIEMQVPVDQLAWFNPDTGSWEIETMEYEVYVGGSSNQNDLLQGTFKVE